MKAEKREGKETEEIGRETGKEGDKKRVYHIKQKGRKLESCHARGTPKKEQLGG